MNLQEVAQRYRGTTLPQLIQHQIKTMTDIFSLAYAEKWFEPHNKSSAASVMPKKIRSEM